MLSCVGLCYIYSLVYVLLLYCVALFLMRDPKFLETVPENLRASFIDENKTIAPAKLSILKKMIADKFPVLL